MPAFGHSNVVRLPALRHLIDVAAISVKAGLRVVPDVAVAGDDDLGLFDDWREPIQCSDRRRVSMSGKATNNTELPFVNARRDCIKLVWQPRWIDEQHVALPDQHDGASQHLSTGCDKDAGSHFTPGTQWPPP